MSVLQQLTRELARSERQIERLLAKRTPEGFYRRGRRGRWRVCGPLTDRRIEKIATLWEIPSVLEKLAHELGRPRQEIGGLLAKRTPEGFDRRGGWRVRGRLTDRRIKKIATLWGIPFTAARLPNGVSLRAPEFDEKTKATLERMHRSFDATAGAVNHAAAAFGDTTRRAQMKVLAAAQRARPAALAVVYFLAMHRLRPDPEREVEIAHDMRTLPVGEFLKKYYGGALTESENDVRLLELLAAVKELQSRGISRPYRYQIAAHMGQPLRTHRRKYRPEEVRAALRDVRRQSPIDRLVDAIVKLNGASEHHADIARMMGVSAADFARDFAALLPEAYALSDELFWKESTPEVYEADGRA